LPYCVRDAAHPVLSQHPLNGTQYFVMDAIGFGQGGNDEESSLPAFAGSKLRGTRHGGVFDSLTFP